MPLPIISATTTASAPEEVDNLAATTCPALPPPPILTLREWFHHDKHGHLLDLRTDTAKFHCRCNNGSKNKQIVSSIPLHKVRDWSFELPPRSTPFCLWLSRLSDWHVFCHAVLMPEPHRHRHGAKRLVPWNVVGIVLDATTTTPDNQHDEAVALGLVEENDAKKAAATTTPQDATFFHVQPRLWEPDPLVKDVLLPLLLSRSGDDNTSRSTVRLVWDAGAGAGRDAAFLAEELRQAHQQQQQHWQVVAMDRRYRHGCHGNEEDNDDPEPCAMFFQRRGLTSRQAVCKAVDLNNVSAFVQRLHNTAKNPSTVLACILMVRFWNDELVQAIATSTDLPPGALFATSQFGIAQPNMKWTWPHPKVGLLLDSMKEMPACVYNAHLLTCRGIQ